MDSVDSGTAISATLGSAKSQYIDRAIRIAAEAGNHINATRVLDIIDSRIDCDRRVEPIDSQFLTERSEEASPTLYPYSVSVAAKWSKNKPPSARHEGPVHIHA